MNVRLLRRIQRIILKRPTQIDMRAWFHTPELVGDIYGDGKSVEIGYCGTTACIAGWAITFDKVGKPTPKKALRRQGNSPAHTAAKALKLTDEQSERLFHDSYWPMNFRDRLSGHQIGSVGYAKTVAARISHFIKTKGRE